MAGGSRLLVNGTVALGVWAVVLGASCGAAADWPPAVFTNSIGMKFVRIPPGEFFMGSTEEDIKAVLARFPGAGEDFYAREKPQHKVRLTTAFFLGKHQVTVGQFRKFVAATGYKTEAETGAGGNKGAEVWSGSDFVRKADACWRKPYFEQTDAHPVVCVSWNDAKKFATWLNASDKIKPAGWAYRLPTEAEWEFAARGPQNWTYPWGDHWDGTRANFADKRAGYPGADMDVDDGYARTAPVGSFSPKGDSPFGACDMAGNVWEWCEDWFGERHPKEEQTDPRGPAAGDRRSLRGGCWYNSPAYGTSAHRFGEPPGNMGDYAGFRVVLAPVPKEPRDKTQGRPSVEKTPEKPAEITMSLLFERKVSFGFRDTPLNLVLEIGRAHV